MARKEDRLFVDKPFRHYRKNYDLREVRPGVVVLLGLACVGAWVAHRGQHPDPGLLALDVVDPGAAAPAPDARGPLPEALAPPGWSERPPKRFGPDNLYVKVNGRADFYKSFGFEQLFYATLEKDGAPTTVVDLELFDLGQPVNALGCYNGERGDDARPEVGESGLAHYARNALYLTRGRYYLRAVGSDETEQIRAALAHVRARFEADLEGEALPWSYALFLGRLELPPDAVAYYAENAFGLEAFANEVSAARLPDETELFVKVAASEAGATEIATKFDAGFASYGEVKAGGFVVDRYIQTVSKTAHAGRWVYGVRGAPDLEAAKAGLSRLLGALEGLEPPASAPAKAPVGPDETDVGEPAYDVDEEAEH